MANVVGVASDLIFASKITATARALGVDATTVSTIEALGTVLDGGQVRLVAVDMSLPGDLAPAALRRCVDHPSTPTTIAFYAHVHTDLKAAAEQAGADQILTNGQFARQLPQLITQYAAQVG
ncbi:MAG: hypothetical protein GY778_19935 [bacterium]|nr:hypothetical protein [bacterium]